MLEVIIAGFMDALQLSNLLFVLVGVTAGMTMGAIPGINGPMAIALCIPLSYYMSPVAAIGFLVGLNKGAFFGGAISAVLLNTPGTPEAAATSWDGYPLTQQGKGEKALRMALYGSVSGDAFSTVVLILVAAPLELQIARLMERDGLARGAALRRIEAQLPLEEKRRVADFVIENTGGIGELRSAVTALKQRIDTLFGVKG